MVKKLVNVIHIKNSELNSLKLQLHHKELQTQTLAAVEFQLQSENEKLGLSLAKSQQDILLLEVRF